MRPLLIVLSLLIATPSFADVILNTMGPDLGGGFWVGAMNLDTTNALEGPDGFYRVGAAQAFTLSSAMDTITGSVLMGAISSDVDPFAINPTATFDIRRDLGGQPGGIALGTSTVHVQSLSFSAHDLNFGALALTAGTYWLVATSPQQRTEGGGTLPHWAITQQGDPLTTMAYLPNNMNWITLHQTFGVSLIGHVVNGPIVIDITPEPDPVLHVQTVPEPATVLLLLSSLCVLHGVSRSRRRAQSSR